METGGMAELVSIITTDLEWMRRGVWKCFAM